jgi:hypothetical protein
MCLTPESSYTSIPSSFTSVPVTMRMPVPLDRWYISTEYSQTSLKL